MDYKYLKLITDEIELATESVKILGIMGVEYLDRGADFETYVIAEVGNPIETMLKRVPGIKEVFEEKPPCAK